MSLTFSTAELATRIKERLRRENSPFVSDAEYVRLIDVAWRRCYNRIARSLPFSFSKTATIPIVSGQPAYDLPADFRSLQSASIFDQAAGLGRPLRALSDYELANLIPPQNGGVTTLRYIPDPVRVTTIDPGPPAQELDLPVACDEWIVNAVVSMVITKEGTTRDVFDRDFAILDAELEVYVDDTDFSPGAWEVQEVFPYWTSPYTSTVAIGYVIRGKKIEFYAWRLPGVFI